MSTGNRVDLCVRTSTCTRYTIVPANGFTAEEIVEMLNKGEVSLEQGSGELVCWAPPPCEGGTAVASVVGCVTESKETTYEIATAADKDEGSK